MSDCVDREAVRGLLYENPSECEDAEMAYTREIYNNAIEDVLELPTVEPESRWIPVGKGLPKKDGYYLATVHINGKTYVHMTQNLDVPDEGVVTAWMPLPEPYRDADMREGESE